MKTGFCPKLRVNPVKNTVVTLIELLFVVLFVFLKKGSASRSDPKGNVRGFRGNPALKNDGSLKIVRFWGKIQFDNCRKF